MRPEHDETGALVTGFAARLREATWPEHKRAESTAYLAALMRGEVDRKGYAAMVAQHYFIYAVLEEAGRAMRDDPVAGTFVTPELERLPALANDLTALLGPGWPDIVTPSPATTRYRDRMREVCFDWPGGFVAHHYTRYLGDLSGGPFLRRGIEHHLGIDPSSGTGFYVFDAIGDPDIFKADYRTALDAAGWSAREQAAITAEATRAYTLNTEVLDALPGVS
jgi:heme oxygenase